MMMLLDTEKPDANRFLQKMRKCMLAKEAAPSAVQREGPISITAAWRALAGLDGLEAL